MQHDFPLTTLPRWKIVTLFLTIFAVSVTAGYFAGRYVYNLGVVAGIEAYHTQCLVGGYLIDGQGQAVICGPLGKAPQEEKQTYKDKVNAPSLF